jgi:steroid 5-alpha reductase family enzyme
MPDMTAMLYGLAASLLAAVVVWAISVWRGDVSIVDSLWSLLFLLALGVYVLVNESNGPRTELVLIMVGLWALRLSAYITVRNHGQGEDRRYRAIRENHQPRFWLKSLYMVFLLQGFLAWVICLPAIAAVSGQAPPGPLDLLGLLVWSLGMFFEVVGDHQLTRFRKRHAADDAVLNTGLWRYTRHPNYFGEAAIWWGVYLIALSAGGGWTIFAPILMTFLLLRVSGVSMLEKDIADRRPAYRDYIRQTNAFFPGKPRPPGSVSDQCTARES